MKTDHIVSLLSVTAVLGLAVLLAGCESAANRAITSQTPLVRATGGAYSSLTVTSCPLTAGGGNILAEMLATLTAQGLIVSATDNGQARLTLNACPFPPDASVITAVGNAQRQAAGRR